MPTYDTSNLTDRTMGELSQDEAAWIYNGLDCCVTLEVFEELQKELRDSPENVQATYAFAMQKQAAFLEMSLRGIRIDDEARQESIALLQAQLDELDGRFQRLYQGAFDISTPLNWRSPMQLKNLFYGILGIKEIKKRNTKGEYAATVDENTLNKLCLHFYAQPFANYILKLREIGKKIGFLQTEIDPDGRMRANINIAGTNTGRASSAMNDFGTGTNLQNVDTTLRYPFIADPHAVFVNVDLEQADARNVAAIIHNLFYEEDERASDYLDAAESGDLHTQVTRMAWYDMDWPEDSSLWRGIADQPFYRDFSYRDTSKRIGHGSNYYGTPPAIAQVTHVPSLVVKEFQQRYFTAFPLIPRWHDITIENVKNFGTLTTLYGRRRVFFGRGADKTTWRKAIAYCPQSMTGEQIDRGITQLWRGMPEAELLMQVHDSILFQIPFHNHQSRIERALELLKYKVDLKGGRPFYVPLEAKVGWNWGDTKTWGKKEFEDGKCRKDQIGKAKENPFGLMKWKREESRTPPAQKKLKDFL